jgi:hypothetical protein
MIPALIAGGLAAAGGIAGAIANASSKPDSPRPYTTDKNAFDYPGEPSYYRDRGAGVRGYGVRRQSDEPRIEALNRIRGYESQAANLQRAGMENARLQQLAAAMSSGPSTRAAALRGAQAGLVQAQQGIAQGARQHSLAEFAAQQQALQGLRGGDLQDELQRQAYQLDKERLAQLYEAQAQQDRQFAAGMSARGEEAAAAAYNASLPSQAAAGAAQYGAQQQLFDRLTGAGGNLLTYAMLAGGGKGGGTPPASNPYALVGTPYAPGANTQGAYGPGWAF